MSRTRTAVLALAATLAGASVARAGDSAAGYFPTLASPTLTLDDAATDLKSPGHDPLAPVPSAPAPRLRSFELPPTVVQPDRVMNEEQLVGSYNQPRWTATRRFATSRVYVVPEGKVELEYWFIPRWNKDHTIDMRSLYEIEIGLGHRLQLDLYFRTDQTAHTNDSDLLVGGQFELRYALADWGVIPGNPTLYFEYIQLESRANRIEPKLLLGGEITGRWHWSANFVWEQEIENSHRGENETELELTSGISYTVFDSVFSVGAESVLHFGNVKGDRSSWETQLLIGPSFQWRPVPQWTINLAPLVGVTEESPDARIYLNTGWEF